MQCASVGSASTGTRLALDAQQLHQVYRRMKTIRLFEESIKREFERGSIPGFVHLYLGQEASAVGVCAHLTDDDYIGSTHRGHGHCIAKGCDVTGMMCEIYGRRPGLCGGKGGSMHIADFERGMLGANAIVGGNPPLVIGAALSAKAKGKGSIAVSFTGDGGSNQGTTFEALNMAVVLQLPAIFVFENNGYGEQTSHDYAVGSKDIARRAASFGLPASRVDGTDFFAVYEAAQIAVDRARSGGGPSVVETVAIRWEGHYMGDPQSYRSPIESAGIRAKDPIVQFRDRCKREGLQNDAALDEIDREVELLVSNAIRVASTAPFPEQGDLLTDVYSSYA